MTHTSLQQAGMLQGLKIWGANYIRGGQKSRGGGASSKGGAKIWGGVHPPCLPPSNMPGRYAGMDFY